MKKDTLLWITVAMNTLNLIFINSSLYWMDRTNAINMERISRLERRRQEAPHRPIIVENLTSRWGLEECIEVHCEPEK